MLETESGIGLVTVVTAGRTLALATAERRAKPTSHEYLSEFENALWKLNRFAMGLSERDVAVADCPWGDDVIRKFMGLGRFSRVANPDFGLFLPEVVSTTPDGLRLMNKAYPEIFLEEPNIPTLVRNEDEEGNVISLFGWLKTEKSIDAPFTGTDEIQARAVIADKHRLAQTLNVYGEAAQESKLLTGYLLDEVKTWVRVLSSRSGGRVVGANFYPNGRCFVSWSLESSVVNGLLGVRSVGV